ncbi:MAG: hypothetical protein ACR2PH_07935 [Desulfobulbia bacterium]
MTATVKNVGMVDFTTDNTVIKKPGGFSRFWNALVESRTRQAQQVIINELQKHTDSTLQFYGYTSQDIADIRKGKFVLPASD